MAVVVLFVITCEACICCIPVTVPCCCTVLPEGQGPDRVGFYLEASGHAIMKSRLRSCACMG